MTDLLVTLTFAAPEATTANAASVAVESVWDFILKGGVMMIPIGLCSLVALTVVVERLIVLRRRHVIPPAFINEIRQALARRPVDIPAAVKRCRENGSSVANVLAAGLRRLGHPLEVVERHIQDTGQRQVRKLRKHLRVLSVIAAVSPLLGLLGTIFGMIRAFQTVATSAEALGKTELLATGIYEAMITTAGGLVVAIPVLICYHWLLGKVHTLVAEIDEISVEFIEQLADGSFAPAASRAAPSAAPMPSPTNAAAAAAPPRAATDVNVATS